MMAGCPQPIIVESGENITSNDVLHDSCEDGDSWFISGDHSVQNKDLIINLGCSQKVQIVQVKNLERDLGGTKEFSIFLSEFSSGPWNFLLKGQMDQNVESGCQKKKMYIFQPKRRYCFSIEKLYFTNLLFSEGQLFGKYLKFQVNSQFNPNGGLSYIGVFGENVKGFTSIVFPPFLML